MNNPKKLNGWTEPMLLSLFSSFQSASSNPSTKAVIITGTGSYYCAGVDLSGTIKPMPPSKLHDMIYTSNKKVFDTFLKFPKPIIAAINGPAIGASVTTSTLCDYVIASESATFLTPFARLGVPPEGCSSVHFKYLMGEQGERMLGDEAYAPTGREAVEIGLIDECVRDEELERRAVEVAEEWIKDEEKIKGGRSHRGFKDTEFMLKVNDGESQDLADSFLSEKFLGAQAKFLESKGKTIPSLVFKILVATRPLWKGLYKPFKQ
ncbi:hypothetical protein TrVE_jg13775 [Triparma verrucosa]|uniref:Uncharacterized protein n=2 Tax=Triparma TaxID=722752 RepID=A0A9W7BW02_9STRA|nr:hypothetical protein TrST_g410 [Triparma strigata]GMI01235.1 hypothetical protein TrVE_jg13775 [Triparma verrucosa]